MHKHERKMFRKTVHMQPPSRYTATGGTKRLRATRRAVVFREFLGKETLSSAKDTVLIIEGITRPAGVDREEVTEGMVDMQVTEGEVDNAGSKG
jgi:hypothetical protein